MECEALVPDADTEAGDEEEAMEVQPQKRGVPASKEELEEWMAAENFSRLPAPRGQEAFFKFLRQSHYEEHVGIIDVPITAPGMESNAARGYQFWLKTEGMNLKGLFDTYVVEDDTKLDEATEPYERLEEKKEKAGEVDDYIKILKAKIKLSLDDQYILFKNLLKEEAKKFK
ncbi:uncharacterized protein LOC122259767 isoform X2 [Penaeus japonicus]|uniref:uncharacterized protein LOC122259767 isoform X2 n=1 Tax=Penaeus japonicus TaxID=27405 RepID=UPI001C70E6B4|nr:uncharacterized protein LOC122259767 isoform X2 [Penaeus japonicus]